LCSTIATVVKKQNTIQQMATYDSWEHMVIWKLVGLYQIELPMAFLTRNMRINYQESNKTQYSADPYSITQIMSGLHQTRSNDNWLIVFIWSTTNKLPCLCLSYCLNPLLLILDKIAINLRKRTQSKQLWNKWKSPGNTNF